MNEPNAASQAEEMNRNDWGRKTIYGFVGTLIVAGAVLQSCDGSPPTQSQDYSNRATIVVDGTPRAITIAWTSDGGTFDSPKTFESSGTFFADEKVVISCEEMRQGQLRPGDRLAVSKALDTWRWSGSPGISEKVRGRPEFTITIPVGTIPTGVSSSCMPEKAAGPAEAGAAGESAGNRTEASPSMAGLRTFEDAELRIGYPSSWQEIPGDIQERFRSALAEGVTLRFAAWSPDTTVNIQVMRHTLTKKGMSVEDFREQVASSQARAGLRPIVLSTAKMSVSGHPGLEEVVSFTTPNGLPAKSALLYVTDGTSGWGVIVGGKPTTFDQERNLIDEALLSFSLKKR